MKINSNGIEINYELSGQGDCLVLIHGFSDNLTMWYNQIPDFSKQQEWSQCSVLTGPGQGKQTTRPQKKK